jgi:hypothetical protein
MAPSPVGQTLTNNKSQWKIGKRLGIGACATVHSLETDTGAPTEFAIKLAPIPTKTSKKQNSPAEINARRLHYEHVVYQNTFSDLQGTLIPKLPSYKGPPASGEANGEYKQGSLVVDPLRRF